VDSSGKLHPLANVASPSRVDARKLAITPDSQWLFSVTGSEIDYQPGDGSVFDQSIASTGQPGSPQQELLGGSTFGSGPAGLKTVLADDDNRAVYTLSPQYRVAPIAQDTGCSPVRQDLKAYSIGAQGSLQQTGSMYAVDSANCPYAGEGPVAVLVGINSDGTHKYLWYSVTQWGRGTAYPYLVSVQLNADGSFGSGSSQYLDKTQAAYGTAMSNFVVLSELQDRMRISPDTITTFRTGGGKATLASQCATTVPACHHAIALISSHDGKFLYTISQPNASEWSVNSLLLDQTTGALMPVGSSVSLPQSAFPWEVSDPGDGPSPMPIALDASGRRLFVLRAGDAKISTIPVDPATGALGAPVDSDTGAQPSSRNTGAIITATK